MLVGHDRAQRVPDGDCVSTGAIGDFVLVRRRVIGVRARDALGQVGRILVVELGQGARAILYLAVVIDLVRDDRRRAVIHALVGIVRRRRPGGLRIGDVHLRQIGSAHGRDLRHRELLGLVRHGAHVKRGRRGGAHGIERARRKRIGRRVGRAVIHVDVRVFHGARAIARDALRQRAAAHGVELRLGVVGNRGVLIRARLADAHDAHGQLVVGQLVELSADVVAGNCATCGVAGDGAIRGIARVGVLDGLVDRVVEVALPDAGGRVLDEVSLRDADRAKVNAALAVGEGSRSSRGLGDGRGGCLAVIVANLRAGGDEAGHRHLGEVDDLLAVFIQDVIAVRVLKVLDVNRVVVGVDPSRLLDRREDEGELILFGMRLTAEALVQPAAALEILHGLDHGAATGLVLTRVGHREGNGVGGGVLNLVAVQHVADVLRGLGLKLVDVDKLVEARQTRQAMLEHAVGVLVAVCVVHRQVFERERVHAVGCRALVDRRAGIGNAHPTRGLILGDEVVALLNHLLRLGQVCPYRTIEHEVGVLVRLAFPDLVHGDGHKLGVGEARLGHAGDREGLGPRRVDTVIRATELGAHALARKLNLDVEATLARVDDHNARVLGRVVVGKLVAVVEGRTRRDDLTDAVLKDAVLVAGFDLLTRGVAEVILRGCAVGDRHRNLLGAVRHIPQVIEREVEGTNLCEERVDARVGRAARIGAFRIRTVQAGVERLAG